MRTAAGRRHMPWHSIMMSISPPTASRMALHRRHRPLEVGGRDLGAAGGRGEAVEGPDLHGPHPLGQQRAGEAGGIVELGLEVVHLALRRLARLNETADPADRGGGVVGGAGAGVVDADLFACPAAQERRHRHAQRLAEDVPERQVDGRVAAHLDRAGGRAHEAVADPPADRLAVQVDRPRVFAQQPGRQRLVDIGLGGLGVAEGLAEAGEAFVGLDPEPEHVAETGDPERLEGGDPQARYSAAATCGPRSSASASSSARAAASMAPCSPGSTLESIGRIGPVSAMPASRTAS